MIYFLIILLSFLGPAVLALPLPASRRTEAANHNASDDISGTNVWESNSSSGRTPDLLLRRSEYFGLPYSALTDPAQFYPESQPNEPEQPESSSSQQKPYPYALGLSLDTFTFSHEIYPPPSQPQPDSSNTKFLPQHSQSTYDTESQPQSNILSQHSQSTYDTESQPQSNILSQQSRTFAQQSHPPPLDDHWKVNAQVPDPSGRSDENILSPPVPIRTSKPRAFRRTACANCHNRKVKCVRQEQPNGPCIRCNHIGVKCDLKISTQPSKSRWAPRGTACVNCHNQKVRCDRPSQPDGDERCSGCNKNNLDCSLQTPSKDPGPSSIGR